MFERILCCVALLAVACVTPGSVREPEVPLTPLGQIARWEDARTLAGGKLVDQALHGPTPEIRARAVLALGRMQRASTVPSVVTALVDADASVRSEAAFAAGLLGLSWEPLPDAAKVQLATAVMAQLDREVDSAAQQSQLSALGQLGTEGAVEALGKRLSAPDEAVRSTAALSLGIAQKRGGKLPATWIPVLAPLASSGEEPQRYAAAYALAQTKQAAARPVLLACLKDAASEVRAVCAKGLNDIATAEDVGALRALLEDEDYRVAVEATRVLAHLSEACGLVADCPAVEALGGLRSLLDGLVQRDEAMAIQPVLALAQAGLPAKGAAVLSSLRAKIADAKSTAPAELQDDLANLDCRLAAAQDRQGATMNEVLHCGGERIPMPWRIALGLREVAKSPRLTQPDRWQPLVHYLDSSDPIVKGAAIDALDAAKTAEVVPRLRDLLSDPDPTVAVSAAGALGDLKDVGSLEPILALARRLGTLPDATEGLADALAGLGGPQAEALLREWLQSKHPQIRITAAGALKKLTGQPVAVPELDSDFPPTTRPAPKNATIAFKTEKGEFVVKLDSTANPLTSGNLYSLAKKGFFDGLSFHRIVPDFVVQGGDPHHDGQGGPGYTIRCEVSRRPYVRGTVGMALSGKDTGGSQFFVTTSPQPHLGGKYTAFGEVVTGMDVVDRLLENDKILKAEALP